MVNTLTGGLSGIRRPIPPETLESTPLPTDDHPSCLTLRLLYCLPDCLLDYLLNYPRPRSRPPSEPQDRPQLDGLAPTHRDAAGLAVLHHQLVGAVVERHDLRHLPQIHKVSAVNTEKVETGQTLFQLIHGGR